MGRILSFLGTLVFLAVALLAGAAFLGGGYWLSDRVYDVGLWPVGALMRVVLLMFLLGYVLTIPIMLITAVLQLFRREDY